MFKTGTGGLIESRVKVFANSWQANEYFRLTSGQTTLKCVRDGVRKGLRDAGLSPELIAARFLTSPSFGEQTAIYTLGYWLQGSSGIKDEYPVDIFTFRMGRAIAAVSFSFVAAKRDEVGLSRLVASRLSQSARG